MKNQMRSLMVLLSAFATIFTQAEVFAYFLGPAVGVPYTEGFMINDGAVATDFADATKGKGVLINRGGGKAQILWFDTDALNTGTKNPHWIAPDKTFLAVTLNGNSTTFVGAIDLTNSDLVFGAGETVAFVADTTKKIPFKKEGAKILYDTAIGGSTTISNVTGLNGTITDGTTKIPTVTNPTEPTTPTTPSTGNSALSSLPTWSWFLIVPVVVVLLVLAAKAIFKNMKGGKKPKNVDK